MTWRDMIEKFLDPLVDVWSAVGAVVLIVTWIVVRAVRLWRRPEHRYVRWFLDRHGTYWNHYLDEAGRVELEHTHIPLSFAGDRSGDTPVPSATSVIANRGLRNVVVLGDAGSGKTTTLKAYGVAALRGQPATRRRKHVDIPFFVPVFALATVLRAGKSLTDYLRSEILKSGAGLTDGEARKFLGQVLRQDRCVVLLDGLDEVGDEDYPAVHAAVHRFASDNSADLPTQRARLVVTCRRYNFLRMANDWTGDRQLFSDRFFTLAPLRDAEIRQYLYKLRERFVDPVHGPDSFMAALQTSKTLDLHRTPLVLAMSVGIYAGRRVYEIPHSIARLYDTMLQEMLDRRRRDADGMPMFGLRFPGEDKLRLLRELSLELAQGQIGFGPFDRTLLRDFAERLRPSLQQVPDGQVDTFLDEIIESSGLISWDPDRRTYQFAHRSIQEHLVASELLNNRGDGAAVLLPLATEREWRQTVLFFAAGASQRVVSPFLDTLAGRDLILAGGCLAVADCADGVAFPILARLVDELAASDWQTVLLALTGLIGATTSPRKAVQEEARRLIIDSGRQILQQNKAVLQNNEAVRVFGGDVHAPLEVVTLLVNNMGQAGLDELVDLLVGMVSSNDSRLVEPLWRFLGSPSMQERIAAGPPAELPLRRLVERLLTLATDPACFTVLQSLDAPYHGFVTDELRREAYPFKNGHDPGSNLVTVLCWAERLGLDAPHVNRFMEAKASDRSAWARIEADRNRGDLDIPVPPLPRIYRVTDRSPRSWLAALALSLLAVAVIVAVVTDATRPEPLLDVGIRLAVVLLAVAELGVAATLFGLGAGLTAGRSVVLWRANPFVDIYAEERSQHWMAVDPGPVDRTT